MYATNVNPAVIPNALHQRIPDDGQAHAKSCPKLYKWKVYYEPLVCRNGVSLIIILLVEQVLRRNATLTPTN
jgi:hypothetical protein